MVYEVRFLMPDGAVAAAVEVPGNSITDVVPYVDDEERIRWRRQIVHAGLGVVAELAPHEHLIPEGGGNQT